MVALKIADNALGVVSTVVLARLLLPSDFGALAMAMSVIALLELMAAFRFDVAIIQRSEVTRDHLDTAWTFNVMFGIAVGLLTYALGAPAAAFYKEPRLEAIMHVLSLGWLAFGLENIGTVAFRKELDFSKEFLFSLSKRVAMFLATVPLAFAIRSYWALVIGVVVGKAISVVISFVVHPYRPKLSLAASRDLFAFSAWLMVNNVLYFVNDRLSNFIIGRISGAQGLGTYNIAYEISCMPTVELAAPINRAVFPGYSKLAADSKALTEAFLNTTGLIALAAMPAGIGIAAIAHPLVVVVLGERWLDAVPLVAILGIYGAIASLGTNTGYVFLAIGKPRLLTLLAGTRGLLLVPLLVTACVSAGPGGAAWALLALEVIYRPLTFWVALRVLDAPWRDLLACLWRPIVASIPMGACVWWVRMEITGYSSVSSLVELAVAVAVGLAVYSASLWTLWWWAGFPRGSESGVLNRIKSMTIAREPA